MRKTVLTGIFSLCAFFAFNFSANAQGTLIHYWHFNNFTTTYNYPTAPPIGINADFSIHDTSKARIVFTYFSGTSSAYHNDPTQPIIFDPYPTVAADFDTANLRMGQTGGTSIRPRNPLDSAYLLFYIPTTNYQNIKLSYTSESSSTASGDTYQYFDYSNDSGATWNTSGLSMLHDSAWTIFHKAAITFSDLLVNNNPKLVFRIHFIGHNTSTKGNDRFDNVTVDGDSIIAPVLIHYWNYNTYTTTYNYPTAPPLSFNADFSLLDVTKATTVFAYFPGTSAAYHNAATQPIIFDPYPTVAADFDTANLRMGAPAGASIRPRNPLDSAYLYFYVPSTGYHDLAFSYDCESSSASSGDTYQYYDYSVDSGATWRNSLLSQGHDSAWTIFHKAVVTFTSDSQVNNNPKLVFRIHFVGDNTGTKGNDRFDNVTLDGIPYIATNTIATTAATYGPFCNASSAPISVAYTTVGTFTGTYAVQLSNPGGTFPGNTTANLIGTGTGTSPISAIIPTGTAPGNYRVRVVNSAPATLGTDNGSNIIINGPPTLETVTGGGGYCAGGAGVAVGLSGSQTGVSYQLYRNGSTLVGSAVPGTGTSFNFSSQTIAGPYTVVATNSATTACTATMTGTVNVTVNPVPSAITGTTTICAGNSVLLNDTLPAGTWSSNFTSVATVVPSTGVVTAVSSGLATISYTLPGGCFKTATVIVNLAVSPIGGTTNVCPGGTTTLNDLAIGTWSSSDMTLATVDPSGNVTGVAAGIPVISYMVSPGCIAFTNVTVNPLPSAISGNMNVCIGGTTSLSDAGGGTWISSDGTLAAVVFTTGTVTGIALGSPNITYTLPTGCMTIATVTVNAQPSDISGITTVCIGTTTTLSDAGGGTWASSDGTLATVDVSSGVVSGVAIGTPNITYTLPSGCFTVTPVTVNSAAAAITGTLNVCPGLTTSLSDVTGAGTWSSSDITLATVDPASGVVTGVASGTPNITYSLSSGCKAVTAVVVNPLPDLISGANSVCIGASTTLSDAGGGTWISDNETLATIDASSGLVIGLSVGSPAITYTLPTGCFITTVFAVDPLPSAISGATSVCMGATANLSDAGGGTWSSSSSFQASVDISSGIVTGGNAGTPTITYTLPTGCSTTAVITVNPSPGAISGNSSVCIGSNISLGGVAGGGTWSSSDESLALVDASSGSVTGVATGSPVITYTLSTGCFSAKTEMVNPLPSAISGAGNVCVGTTTPLTDDGPGTWSSSSTAHATVGVSSGIVTGVTAGAVTITYTLEGCTATIPVVINPNDPVTGVMRLCAGAGVTLSNGLPGGTWSTSNATLATIDILTGSVTGVAAGMPVIAYTLPTGCVATAVITVNASPATQTITGGGNVCAGGAGVGVSLGGSSAGVTYQLFNGISPVGAPLSGTGVALNFGLHTTTGIYTVVATNAASGCTTTMSGTAPVVINPLPTVFTVTGGGSYCAGTGGLHVGLTGSGAGVNYQLYHGITLVGSPVAGTGFPLDFGAFSTDETYVVVATDIAAGCTDNMAGEATVITNSLPAAYPMTGGGNFCDGGTGVAVGLTLSASGINYQLYNGATPVGPLVAGGSGPVNFGLIAAAGTYTAKAISTATGCVNNMLGSATVAVSPIVTPSVTVSTGVGDTLCSGSFAHITALAANGGMDPLYEWAVNGVAHPALGSTLNYIPSDGDIVSVTLVSSLACVSRPTATAALGLTVFETGNPGAMISADPGNTVCSGTLVNYTNTNVFGGLPSFTWVVNGISMGTDPFYAYVPANSDNIYLQMVSNYYCRTTDTVKSNHIIMNVQNPAPPTVTITADPAFNIARGQAVTLTATVANGGPSPAYQWLVNGSPVPGANSSTYSNGNFNNLDSVTCQVVSDGVCAGQHGHKSVTINVNSVGVASLSLSNGAITLVPNPNKGAFTVKGTLGSSVDAEVSLIVTDMLGQVVYRNNVTAPNGMLNEQLLLNNNLANGMYLLNVRSGDQNSVFHFVMEK